MEHVIGLKELRENVDTYVAAVKKGGRFLVVRKSKPVFLLTSPRELDGAWETALDFTEFYAHGIPARRLLKKLRALHGKAR